MWWMEPHLLNAISLTVSKICWSDKMLLWMAGPFYSETTRVYILGLSIYVFKTESTEGTNG